MKRQLALSLLTATALTGFATSAMAQVAPNSLNVTINNDNPSMLNITQVGTADSITANDYSNGTTPNSLTFGETGSNDTITYNPSARVVSGSVAAITQYGDNNYSYAQLSGAGYGIGSGDAINVQVGTANFPASSSNYTQNQIFGTGDSQNTLIASNTTLNSVTEYDAGNFNNTIVNVHGSGNTVSTRNQNNDEMVNVSLTGSSNNINDAINSAYTSHSILVNGNSNTMNVTSGLQSFPNNAVDNSVNASVYGNGNTMNLNQSGTIGYASMGLFVNGSTNTLNTTQGDYAKLTENVTGSNDFLTVNQSSGTASAYKALTVNYTGSNLGTAANPAKITQ